jgi:hypothetical protein
MSYRHSLLEVAVARYLTSEYFLGLAPMTRKKRRNVLKHMCAEVRRLSEISEAEISATEARKELHSTVDLPPSDPDPPHSAPRRGSPRRRNWITA